MNLQALLKQFDPKDVHWRAQSVTKDGTKAMALAYIDARAVMERLDEVCGPAGWQDKYQFEQSGKKTICGIGIKCGEEWVWKFDGAGDTDVEAEKGALSDAFKRAAVKWGIGRYLYDMPAQWVACESRQGNGGRWQFVKFTETPGMPKPKRDNPPPSTPRTQVNPGAPVTKQEAAVEMGRPVNEPIPGEEQMIKTAYKNFKAKAATKGYPENLSNSEAADIIKGMYGLSDWPTLEDLIKACDELQPYQRQPVPA